MMAVHTPFSVFIDKLTRSIENITTGESLSTEVLQLAPADLKQLGKTKWLFNWKLETAQADREVFKLVIHTDPNSIQGLISLIDKGDHIFMSLIESAKLNKGKNKQYAGVPGNLVAFACARSFSKGYGGYVSFESKSKLIVHYQKSLGTQVLFGNIMAINGAAAVKLIDHYFPEKM